MLGSASFNRASLELTGGAIVYKLYTCIHCVVWLCTRLVLSGWNLVLCWFWPLLLAFRSRITFICSLIHTTIYQVPLWTDAHFGQAGVQVIFFSKKIFLTLQFTHNGSQVAIKVFLKLQQCRSSNSLLK